MITSRPISIDTPAGWQSLPNALLHWTSFGIKPNQHIRGHHHQKAHLCIVQEGVFEEYDGSRYIACPSGTVRLSMSESGHELITGGDAASGKILELSPAWGYDDQRFWQVAYSNRYLYTSEAQPGLGELISLLEKKSHRPHLQIHLFVRRLLAQIAFCDVSSPSWYTHIQDYLDKNFKRPAIPTTLAKEARLHRTHFARQFFLAFGCTISEYVNIKRLDYAQTLLDETNLTLSALAYEAAFSDQSHLTRSFKRFLGTTPGEYRRVSRSTSSRNN